MEGLCDRCKKDAELYKTWENEMVCIDCYEETSEL